MGTEQQYSVWHVHEEIIFTGMRIAHATTEQDSSVRWIEIDIYRTKGGRYVIQRVGVSLVYHVHGIVCRDPVTGKDITGIPVPFDQLRADAEPCGVCKPPYTGVAYDLTVDTETNRPTAAVCDASQVQDNLMVHPKNGVPFLSSPARKALDQAVANDPILADMLRKKVRLID